MAAIKEIVGAFALLHPHVRFHLTIDSRAAVSTNGDGDRRRTVAAIYGAQVAAEMLEMVGMPLVTGMVSQPRLSRGSRRRGVLLAIFRTLSQAMTIRLVRWTTTNRGAFR